MRCSVVRVTPCVANSRRAATRICWRVCSDSSLVLRTADRLNLRTREFTYTLDCIIIRDRGNIVVPASSFLRDFQPMSPIDYQAPGVAPRVVCTNVDSCFRRHRSRSRCSPRAARKRAPAAAPPPVPVHVVKVEPRSVPDPLHRPRADRGIEAGRGARPRFGHSAEAVLQRGRCGQAGRAAVRDRSRAIRGRARAGEGAARAGDRAGRPGAPRRSAAEAAGRGARGEPQGIRRRDVGATTRRSVAAAGERPRCDRPSSICRTPR